MLLSLLLVGGCFAVKSFKEDLSENVEAAEGLSHFARCSGLEVEPYGGLARF